MSALPPYDPTPGATRYIEAVPWETMRKLLVAGAAVAAVAAAVKPDAALPSPDQKS